MDNFNKDSRKFNFEIYSPVLGVIALGVFLCGISLSFIGLQILPISRHSRIWNSCVETTKDFLWELPNFENTLDSDLQAMAVNLCNGSIPQKVENTSSISK